MSHRTIETNLSIEEVKESFSKWICQTPNPVLFKKVTKKMYTYSFCQIIKSGIHRSAKGNAEKQYGPLHDVSDSNYEHIRAIRSMFL